MTKQHDDERVVRDEAEAESRYQKRGKVATRTVSEDDLKAALRLMQDGALTLTGHLSNLVVGAVTTEELLALKADGGALEQAIHDLEALLLAPDPLPEATA